MLKPVLPKMKSAARLLAAALLALSLSAPARATVDIQPMLGLLTNSAGLTAKSVEVKLAGPHSGVLDRPLVSPQDTLSYVFSDVKGFDSQSGKNLFALSTWVTDEAGKTITALPKFMVGDQATASYTITLHIGQLKLQPGKRYIIRTRVEDQSSDHYIEARQRVTVAASVKHPNMFFNHILNYSNNLEVRLNQCKLKGISLMDEATGEKIQNATLPFGHRANLRLFGLQGFKLSGGKGSISAEAAIYDAAGKEVLYAPQIFSAAPIANAVLADNLKFTFKADRGTVPSGRYLWVVRLQDRLGQSEFASRVWLNLQ